jgi:hypothetical protein
MQPNSEHGLGDSPSSRCSSSCCQSWSRGSTRKHLDVVEGQWMKWCCSRSNSDVQALGINAVASGHNGLAVHVTYKRVLVIFLPLGQLILNTCMFTRQLLLQQQFVLKTHGWLRCYDRASPAFNTLRRHPKTIRRFKSRLVLSGLSPSRTPHCLRLSHHHLYPECQTQMMICHWRESLEVSPFFQFMF